VVQTARPQVGVMWCYQGERRKQREAKEKWVVSWLTAMRREKGTFYRQNQDRVIPTEGVRKEKRKGVQKEKTQTVTANYNKCRRKTGILVQRGVKKQTAH